MKPSRFTEEQIIGILREQWAEFIRIEEKLGSTALYAGLNCRKA